MDFVPLIIKTELNFVLARGKLEYESRYEFNYMLYIIIDL